MSYNKLVTATLNTLVDRIATGTGDWRASWVGGGMPRNHLTEARYTGVNVLQLWCEAQVRGFQSQEWATKRQWTEAGYQIAEEHDRKGTIILVYKKWYPKGVDKSDPEAKPTAFMRCYNVFNTEQLVEPPEITTLPGTQMGGYADRMLSLAHRNGIKVMEGGGPPAYWPSYDHVTMPDIERFRSQNGYAHDLAHELTHATGHKSRLDRNLEGIKGGTDYAIEELVAELGATYLCVDMGIPLTELESNAASYLVGWAQRAQKVRGTKDDMLTQLVSASKQATKAFEYLVEPTQMEEAA